MGLFKLTQTGAAFWAFVLISAGLASAGNVKTVALKAGHQSVCIECHLAMDQAELTDAVKAFTNKEGDQFADVHARAGLSCQNCHGGDPNDADNAKDEKTGYIGKPSRSQIPGLCGRCHGDIEYMRQFNPKLPTDQLREYETSIHGKKLSKGDGKVATCISCHGAHGIRPVKDPVSSVYPTHVPETCAKCHANAAYMKEYGIPTNQFENYSKSRHGIMVLQNGDITAPVCNTCHGNHGATAPGVSAVHNICGTCHAQQDEFFSRSSHAKAFRDRNLPGCVTCHSNHNIAHPSDEMLELKPGGACVRCHKTGDSCYVAVGHIKTLITGLEKDSKEAEEKLNEVEKLGMGVEKAKFSLNEISDKLTMARIKLHQFKPLVIEDEIGSGEKIVKAARQKAEKALAEWQFRRIGLLVSLVLILITIVFLVLKIRSMGKMHSEDS